MIAIIVTITTIVVNMLNINIGRIPMKRQLLVRNPVNKSGCERSWGMNRPM